LRADKQQGETSDGMSENSQESTPDQVKARRELLESFAPMFNILGQVPEVDTLRNSESGGSTCLQLRTVSMVSGLEGEPFSYAELDPETNVIRSKRIPKGDESIVYNPTTSSAHDDNTSVASSLYEKYQDAATASADGSATPFGDQSTAASGRALPSLSDAFSKAQKRWAWPKQAKAT
jgi:hypothetical protein